MLAMGSVRKGRRERREKGKEREEDVRLAVPAFYTAMAAGTAGPTAEAHG
jgi:hypothetical protein